MIYEPDRIVQDFAQRTQTNLQAIRRLRDNGESVYEVTQFINSLLGLLVFPKEEFFEVLPSKTSNQLLQDGWPLPQVSHPFRQVRNLRELIKNLRNAVAHFNIEFLSENLDPMNDRIEIAGLRIHNVNPRTDEKVWEAIFPLRDLEIITERLLELVLQINTTTEVLPDEHAPGSGQG